MKANIEDKGVKGDCTPLMEAANAGYVDIIQLLIANGADVNAKSTAGKTCGNFEQSDLHTSQSFITCHILKCSS